MKRGSTTRRYSPEFKKDAVALLNSSGRPVVDVARELGVTDTTLGTWARAAARAGGEDMADAEKEEAVRLGNASVSWRARSTS